MLPIVTGPVAWSVGLLVCHTSESFKNGCTDRDAVWLKIRVGPGNHVLDGGPDPNASKLYVGSIVLCFIEQ